MKNRIITLCVVLFLLVGVWLTIDFFILRKPITFTLIGDDYSLQIRSPDDKKIAELNKSKSMRLRPGTYLYNVIGSKYESKSVMFTVEKANEVVIRPLYTIDQRKQLSREYIGDISKIVQRENKTSKSITVTDFQLSPDIQWGYGKIQIDDDHTTLYRFVVKRHEDSWVIHIPPKIVISINESNGAPKDGIYDLY